MQQILLHKTKRGKKMNFIKTKYGKIATSNNRYLTNRNKEHYFVVYGGFGISSTEIEIMIQNQVKEILIYYHHSNKDLTIYKTTPDTTNVYINTFHIVPVVLPSCPILEFNFIFLLSAILSAI